MYNNDFGIKYFKYVCSIAFGQQPFMKITTLHIVRNDRVSVNVKKDVYTKVILTSAAELAVLISSSFPLPLFSFARPSVSLLRLVPPIFSFLLQIVPLKFENNVIRYWNYSCDFLEILSFGTYSTKYQVGNYWTWFSTFPLSVIIQVDLLLTVKLAIVLSDPKSFLATHL